jgi:hypothetical protein
MRALTSIVVILSFGAGCATLAIPEAEGRRPSLVAPEGAATVLFVLGGLNDRAPAVGALPRPWQTSGAPMATAVDVLDESGELLGRLRNRSWLEIQRPSGPATFYAASTTFVGCENVLPGWCPPSRGMASVGLLRAELEAGRVYAVWLGSALTGEPFDTAPPCVSWAEVPGSAFVPRLVSQDLVAVAGTGWTQLEITFSHPDLRGMRPAPRGLVHPQADAIRAGAEARTGRCWNRKLSTLRASDGQEVSHIADMLRQHVVEERW